MPFLRFTMTVTRIRGSVFIILGNVFVEMISLLMMVEMLWDGYDNSWEAQNFFINTTLVGTTRAYTYPWISDEII